MQDLHIQIRHEPWLDVMAAIYGRRAVRRYKSEPLTHETIDRLVDAAIQAPSAVNAQPWAFLIVEGVEKLRAYSERARAYLLKQRRFEDPNLLRLISDAEFKMFYNAPALIVICATSSAGQADEDCCLAAQNLMLVAYAAGLGTCPVGLSRPWLRSAQTKRELGIPLEFEPVFPLVAGVPDEFPSSPGRRAPHLIWA